MPLTPGQNRADGQRAGYLAIQIIRVFVRGGRTVGYWRYSYLHVTAAIAERDRMTDLVFPTKRPSQFSADHSFS